MKGVFMFAGAAIASAALALSLAGSAFAWHPDGEIVKEVKNLTQNSGWEDANSAASAVTAEPGDTLKFRITVKNVTDHPANGYNELWYIKVTDNLPAGLTLVSGRTGNNSLENLSAGEQASYTFTATVNQSVSDGEVVCNTASFTGNSEVRDNPQSGSDDACVEVNVPPEPAYSCDNLELIRLEGGRTVQVSVDYTAANGAELQSVMYDFGDGNTEMVHDVSDGTVAAHTYEVAGEKTVRAELTFLVNGEQRTVTSDACAVTISYDVPPQPDKPEQPGNPEQPKQPAPGPKDKTSAPDKIPATGPVAALSAIIGVSSLAGAGTAYFRSRRFLA